MFVKLIIVYDRSVGECALTVNSFSKKTFVILSQRVVKNLKYFLILV